MDRPSGPSSRGGSSPRPLTFALAVLALWAASFPLFARRGPVFGFSYFTLAALSGNEAVLYAIVALVELPVSVGIALWLARGAPFALERAARFALARRGTVAAVLAGGTAVAALAVAGLALRFHTLTEDEKTYLFQAKLLLLGRLTTPVPAAADALWQPFIVESAGRWSGQYFWAQSALLALVLPLHAAYVVPALEVGCTVYFTYRLAGEITEDGRAALVAALLVASSPIVLWTGATLLSASLATACGAVALWAVARLAKTRDATASCALGLSTGIGLHCRPLDHVTLMLGAGCVLAVARRWETRTIARRLAPAAAIAAPFVLAHPFLNAAISGDWRHSGYWLYYRGHDWRGFGFGTGTGGFPHTPAMAAAKTLSNTLRMAFYAFGGPWLWALLPAAFALGAERAPLRAGAAIAALYVAVYFFYASTPIAMTGPVYFEPLMPVVATMTALAAVAVHNRIAMSTGFGAAVPAFAVAHLVAAALVFWPPALLELRREAVDAARCDNLAAGLDPIRPALVFVAPAEARVSWTYWPPMPSPHLDDRVLFARSAGPDIDSRVAAQIGAGRDTYLARCVAAPEPGIDRYDVGAGHDAGR